MWIKAKVVKGLEIGTKFGIATANLELTDLPDIKEGVYLVSVKIKEHYFGGLLHFGPRKTFGGDFSAEVHILDFNENIYDKSLSFSIEKKLRPVQAFKNADVLFTQIEKDIVQARKFFLRKRIRAHWENLSLSDEAHLASEALVHLAANVDFLEAPQVFVYAPMLHKEITFVASLMKAYPDKKYCFPKIIDQAMAFYAVDDYQTLETGAYALLEPTSTKAILPQSEDVIIVPAVAADKIGNRLGQGGGYYDTYLASLKADPVRIAVLPWFAVVDEIPTETHDQSFDKLIICRL